jgi:hypothetical protein
MDGRKRSHRITLRAAQQVITRYRNFAAEQGGAFSREAIQQLLDQKGCAGLRFYYGMHPDGSPALVLVGHNAKGEDLHPGVVLEEHLPCPPFCPLNSALQPGRPKRRRR